MPKPSQHKQELIKLLKEIDDVNVLMISYGDKKDLLRQLEKLMVKHKFALITIAIG